MLKNIYWSNEKPPTGLSHVPGVDIYSKPMLSIKSTGKQKSKNQIQLKSKNGSHSSSYLATKPKVIISNETALHHQASLKDLCPEDKERVANLIRELAKAGEEKEASQIALNKERKQFVVQLDQLKADKERIEQEQRSLLSEFKECQRLLVFYQQKITEEQKEVTRDINRLLAESSLSKSHLESSTKKLSPRREEVIADDLVKDITVHEVEGTISTHRSAMESPSSDARFADVAGELGESFRPVQKKAHFACPQSKSRVNIGERLHQADSDELSSILNAEHGIGLQRDLESNSFGESDSTDVLEERLRSMSPNGRRMELLKQKRNLEVEQAHLQKLLIQQEEILKNRQKELQRRHKDYTKRMRQLKHSDPVEFSTSHDNNIHNDKNTTDNHVDLSTSNYNAESLKSRMNSKQESVIIGTPRWIRSTSKPKPHSEPVLHFRKYLDEPTIYNVSKEFTPAVINKFSTESSHTPNATRSALSEERKFIVKRLSNEYTRNGINNITNSLQDHQQEKNPLLETSALGSASRFHTRYKDSSLISETESSTYHHSPYPVSHQRSTMNNISTLSDLVTSVENSQTDLTSSRGSTFLHSVSNSSQQHSNETLVSFTFDPEDSQLLEDIFFIK